MGRNKNEVDQLKETIRVLEAQIKHLKKELKKGNKNHITYLEFDPSEKTKEIREEPLGNKCPICARGNITTEKLGVRYLHKCSRCEYSRFSKSATK